MPRSPKTRSNAPYADRASKRRRRLGDVAEAASNVIDAIAADRRRLGRKQYRFTDLRGTERVEMLRMVRDCAMSAMTNFEIASYFGVKEETLNEWVMKDPEFAIAMRLPRELADDRVEKALYARAVGYSFASEEIKITEEGTVHRAAVVKHIPPDVQAGFIWLKNRRGWKDKLDVDANISGELTVEDKGEDPRLLAMAVLDVIQQAIYAKLPPTIEGEPVTVAQAAPRGYTDEQLEKMDVEELERLWSAEEQD